MFLSQDHMACFKTYLTSFQEKIIPMIFGIEAFFAALWAVLFLSVSSYLNARSAGLPSPEQFQQLLTAAPLEAQAAFASLKSFVIVSFLIVLLFAVLFLLSYSFVQSFIWNKLLKKPFHRKSYWKWNVLHIVLIIPSLLYLFILLIITLVLQQISFLSANVTVATLFFGFLKLLYIFIFIFFIFLVYYSFTKSYYIWGSIGYAFSLLKLKWSSLWKQFLFSLGTFIVVGIILTVPPKIFLYNQTILQVIDAIVFLLFLAWFRVYLVRTLDN